MADLEIREQIARYVDGEIDASALEDWLEDASWASADPAESIAPTALRLLAEHSNGDWTDAELRDQLAVVARLYTFGLDEREVSTGSLAHVIRCQASPVEAAGILRVAASV